MVQRRLSILFLGCLLLASGACGDSSPTDDAAVDVQSDGATTDSADDLAGDTSVDGPASDMIADGATDMLPDGDATVDGSSSFALGLTIQGQGRVASGDNQIICTFGCTTAQHSYGVSQTITFTAVPACGWRFSHWQGDCQANGSVLVDGNKQCTAVFQQEATPNETLTDSSNNFSVVLGPDATHGIVPTQITRGNTTFALASQALWQIQLQAAGMADLTVSPSDAGAFYCYRNQNEAAAELHWRDINTADGDTYNVDVRAHVIGGEAQVRFDGRVDFDATSAGVRGVARLDLPRVHFVNRGAQSELYVGSGPGLRVVDPAVAAVDTQGQPLDLRYPSVKQLMRFNAYADPSEPAVAIVSVSDLAAERFRHKQFIAGADSGNVVIGVGRLFDDPTVAQNRSVAGSGTLTLLPCVHAQACWWSAANWYRGLVESEGFLTRPPIGQTTGAVRGSLDYGALILVGESFATLGSTLNRDYQAYIDYQNDMASYLNLPKTEIIGLWYDWHTNPFDADLPEHLPPLGDFATKVAAATAQGYRIMPYTNTNGWGTTLPSYATHSIGSQAGLIGADNTLQIYNDALNKPSVVLDHGSDFIGPHLIQNLFSPLYAMGLAGMYLDAFPGGERCYATNHGHPVGGADSYVNKVRAYFSGIAAAGQAMGRTPLVFNEAMAEYVVDLANGANWYRGINVSGIAQIDNAGHIPMFDVVYRDRISMSTLGPSDIPGNPLLVQAKDAADGGDPSVVNLILDDYFLKLGAGIAAGHTLPLIRRPEPDTARGVDQLKDDPYFASMMTAYRDATEMRSHPLLKRFTIEGRMAPPLSGVQVLEVAPVSGDALLYSQRTKVPTVYHQVLMADNGDFAVMLYNWTGVQQLLSGAIDPAIYGMANNGSMLTDTWAVTAYIPGQVVPLTSDLNTAPNLLVPDFPVPPRVPAVVVYEKVTP